jgi:hypothetical protein
LRQEQRLARVEQRLDDLERRLAVVGAGGNSPKRFAA